MAKLVPPAQPAPISKLSPAEQAQFAQLYYDQAIDFAGKCLKNNDVLIQWILGSP